MMKIMYIVLTGYSTGVRITNRSSMLRYQRVWQQFKSMLQIRKNNLNILDATENYTKRTTASTLWTALHQRVQRLYRCETAPCTQKITFSISGMKAKRKWFLLHFGWMLQQHLVHLSNSRAVIKHVWNRPKIVTFTVEKSEIPCFLV